MTTDIQKLIETKIIFQHNWRVAYLDLNSSEGLDLTTVAIKLNRAKRRLKIRGLVAILPGGSKPTDQILFEALTQYQGRPNSGLSICFYLEKGEPLNNETFEGLRVKDFSTHLDASKNEALEFKATLKYQRSHSVGHSK